MRCAAPRAAGVIAGVARAVEPQRHSDLMLFPSSGRHPRWDLAPAPTLLMPDSIGMALTLDVVDWNPDAHPHVAVSNDNQYQRLTLSFAPGDNARFFCTGQTSILPLLNDVCNFESIRVALVYDGLSKTVKFTRHCELTYSSGDGHRNVFTADAGLITLIFCDDMGANGELVNESTQTYTACIKMGELYDPSQEGSVQEHDADWVWLGNVPELNAELRRMLEVL